MAARDFMQEAPEFNDILKQQKLLTSREIILGILQLTGDTTRQPNVTYIVAYPNFYLMWYLRFHSRQKCALWI